MQEREAGRRKGYNNNESYINPKGLGSEMGGESNGRGVRESFKVKRSRVQGMRIKGTLPLLSRLKAP
jgi:hypothetical protein